MLATEPKSNIRVYHFTGGHVVFPSTYLLWVLSPSSSSLLYCNEQACFFNMLWQWYGRCSLASSSHKHICLCCIFNSNLILLIKKCKVNQKDTFSLVVSLVPCKGGLAKLSVKEMVQRFIHILGWMDATENKG